MIHLKRVSIFAYLLALLFIFRTEGYASQKFGPKKMALLPITVNAEENLESLERGVFELLKSRLTILDTFFVFDRALVEGAIDSAGTLYGESLALVVGAQLKADYVLYGSLTTSKEKTSIMMSLVDIAGVKSKVTFLEHVANKDEVIPRVNQFINSLNVRDYCFSSTISDSQIVEEAKLDATKQPLTATKPIAQKHEPEEKKIFPKEYWKSPTYGMPIIGIALGDVDRDSANELVVLTENSLILYRCKGKNLLRIKEIYSLKNRYPLSVDIADINNNGTPEIFITALDDFQSRVNSTVLEFDGSSFPVIAKNIHFYLRVSKHQAEPILLGQKGSVKGPFVGKIFMMHAYSSNESKGKRGNRKGRQRLEYTPGKEITPSRSISVLGSALGNITGKSKPSLVAYDKFDYIKVLNQTGKEIWNNHETYGGNTRYFKLPTPETASEAITFFPMRIGLDDLDRDGTLEVIAVKNYAFAKNMIGTVRRYVKAHIEVFTWNNYGMIPLERSELIPNYVRDFAIGDFNNDGKKDFVAALILKESNSIFVKPQSTLIAYTLNLK